MVNIEALGAIGSSSAVAERVAGVGINRSACPSVAFVDDAGRPIYAACEERFTRQPVHAGSPGHALAWGAERYDLTRAAIALGRLDTRRRIVREGEYYQSCRRNGRFAIPATERLSEVARIFYRARVRGDADVPWLASRQLLGRGPDLGVEHHLCHLASAYYCSGFDEAVAVSYDGVGDLLSATVGEGVGERLEISRRYFQGEENALQICSVIAAMIGLDPERELSVLAAMGVQGNASPSLVAELDAWFAAQYRARGSENWFYLINAAESAENIARLRQLRLTRFERWSVGDLAAAAQLILERDVLALVRRHVPDPRGRSIVLAGSAFANARLNRRLLDLGFDRLFVQPAADDEGTALGAAIMAAHTQRPFAPRRLATMALGPWFSGEEIAAALRREELRHEYLPAVALEQRLAHMLAEGKVVARFEGRMEFSRQGLGNRSILVSPTAVDRLRRLNRELGRPDVAPLTPVTLAEQALSRYDGLRGGEEATRFMMLAVGATERMRREAPLCVGRDGLCTPQILHVSDNPSFHRMLSHHHDLTGVPTLVSLPFAIDGEPMVCSPAEAIAAFLRSEIDLLAIGNFIVEHPTLAKSGTKGRAGRRGR